MPFERDQDFTRFVGWITKGEHTDERISQESKIGMSTVKGYRDMAIGKVFAENSTVPSSKIRYVVGFRYRRLERWIYTDAIMEARRKYDEGDVEMAQGLYTVNGEEAWVLFSIPRKRKRQARFNTLAYFSAKTE